MVISFTDLASFQLALMGIMVSVLTLVFAIVIGKRDELRTLKSINDPLARNRKVALNNSVDTLSSFCSQILTIIVVLLLLYLGTIVLNGAICEENKCLATVVDTVFTGAILIWIVIISIVIWNRVNKV